MRHYRRQLGFTLIELMVAFTIAGLLMAMSTPMVMRMYDTMVYRGAVRDMVSAVETTRYLAITEGKPVDLVIVPADNAFHIGDGDRHFIPEELSLQVEVAQEVSHFNAAGTIRYYPDGSSSGGSIIISRPSGAAVKLRVDWLLGKLMQESYDAS